MSEIVLGIIGGTGLEQIQEFTDVHEESVKTPFGEPSAMPTIATLGGKKVAFIPRHGKKHTIAPHQVNYRANISVMKQLGIENIIAISAVGGITSAMGPGTLALPDQLLDYTYGREHTFYEDNGKDEVMHIDFTHPYSSVIRHAVMKSAASLGVSVHSHAVLGVMQGPRLETAAEIDKLARDGCDIVNMTALPEASLAREAGLNMANIALVVNWAAGRSDQIITQDDVKKERDKKGAELEQLLVHIIKQSEFLS